MQIIVSADKACFLSCEMQIPIRASLGTTVFLSAWLSSACLLVLPCHA